jgi:hypothetical protein
LVWIFQQNILRIFTIIIHVSYTIFIHDISMYIYITYVDAHTCQSLNPNFLKGTPRFSPPKTLQDSDEIERKCNFIIFNMKLF